MISSVTKSRGAGATAKPEIKTALYIIEIITVIALLASDLAFSVGGEPTRHRRRGM
jgi:hypothetical protein